MGQPGTLPFSQQCEGHKKGSALWGNQKLFPCKLVVRQQGEGQKQGNIMTTIQGPRWHMYVVTSHNFATQFYFTREQVIGG